MGRSSYIDQLIAVAFVHMERNGVIPVDIQARLAEAGVSLDTFNMEAPE